MSSGYKPYTHDEVKRILDGEDIRSKDICYAMRLAYKVWANDNNTKKYTGTFARYIFKFFKRYEKERTGTSPLPATDEPTIDGMFEKIQTLILDVIVLEVGSRMRKEREDHKKEMDELKKSIREAAVKSNWTYMLRQKLGGI